MLICSDFDKTIFFRNDDKKTQSNLMAITRWRQLGHQFAVVTNRSLSSLGRTLPEYQKYFDYLIMDSGSEIFKSNGKIVWSTRFDENVVHELLNITKSLPETPTITYFNATERDYSFTILENLTKMRFWFKEYENAHNALPIVKEINPKTFLIRYDDLTDKKSALYGFRAFLDIIPQSSGKELAVEKLRAILRLDNQDVFTIGDGDNDVAMIKAFDGYAITGSTAAHSGEFRQINSLADLIESKI